MYSSIQLFQKKHFLRIMNSLRTIHQRLDYQILDELNVKQIKFTEENIKGDESAYALAIEGDYQVAVATELTPELMAEGVAREIVRRLQTMRRSAGPDISDYIIPYYQGEYSIQQVIATFADYIQQETLSQQIVDGVPDMKAYVENYTIDGNKVLLGIARVE